MASAMEPGKDSTALHLVVATPQEIHTQTIANSQEWRGPLSLDAYVRREAELSTMEIAREGRLTAWVLVYQPDLNESRQVVCGCETYKRNALVGKNGSAEAVICYTVASVFCLPKFRGCGFAGRMMAELAKKLQTWQLDAGQTCLFSTLYSDIGKDFYAAKGWQPVLSTKIVLPAMTSAMADDVQLLNSGHIAELCATDEMLIHQRLTQLDNEGRIAIAVLPDQPTISWHHAREDIVGQELRGAKPDVRGALIRLSPARRAWCYWARVWASPSEDSRSTLYILRLVVEDEDHNDCAAAGSQRAFEPQSSDMVRAIASLFEVAQCQAEEWDMQEICIWNPTSTTLAAAQLLDKNVKVITRETESIASLNWYGNGSWKDVDWICNEKYGWC